MIHDVIDILALLLLLLPIAMISVARQFPVTVVTWLLFPVPV